MTAMNWQDYIAIGIVLLALKVVGKCVIQPYFEGKYGCGSGCGSCTADSKGLPTRELLTIEGPGNEK